MDHQDALQEMSVEKYLLGELSGPSRDQFEEHLFECAACAMDVKSSVTFAEAARLDLAAETKRSRSPEKSRRWTDWLFSPQWMAPALAACLLLVGYQSFLRVPDLKQQLAQAESPRLLNNLALAEGALRGGSVPHVAVPENGAVLLSVDLPPQAGYSSYLCSLYAPSGKLVWQGSVLPSSTNETIQLSVPAASTQPGENTLLIQGVRGVRQDAASGAAPEDLAKHLFVLDMQK